MSNTPENITLGEVAEIKKGTVESIQTYLAGKGVAIPSDPNYALSATELKAIDPILAFLLITQPYKSIFFITFVSK